MATKILIELDVDLSETEVNARLAAADAPTKLQQLFNFMQRIRASILPATIKQGVATDGEVSLVKAVSTITVATGGSENDQTMVICGVTFTGKTSGATGNQFNVSATAATQAENMRAAIAGSANLAGIVTATRSGAVVTLTSVVPGKQGNGLECRNVNLANVTVAGFSTGAGVVPDLYLDLLEDDLASYNVNR